MVEAEDIDAAFRDRRARALLFRFRHILFPVAGLMLLLPGHPLAQSPLRAVAIGAVIALLGQSLRIVTVGFRYIVPGGRGGQLHAQDLVTEGMYALSRNPMYVGNILIIAGLAFASDSLAALLCVTTLALFVYSAIVTAEEHYLRGVFGIAFESYCRDVPRWIPRPGDAADLLATNRFHWRRVIAKEYGTPVGWISLMCFVTLCNLHRAEQLDASARSGLLLVLGITAAFWLTARVLKKKRLLLAD